MKNTDQELKNSLLESNLPFFEKYDVSSVEEAVNAVQELRSSLLEDNPCLLDEFDVRTIDEAVMSVLVNDLERENAIKEKYLHYLLKKQDLMKGLKDETFIENLMRKIELRQLTLKFNYEMLKVCAVNLFISLRYKTSNVFQWLLAP